MDEFSNKVLEYGEDLESDQPGFTDVEYRKSRIVITKLASDFKQYVALLYFSLIANSGMPIARVEYTDKEIATWRVVYTELKNLYKTNACKQHNYVLPLLEQVQSSFYFANWKQNCGYGPNNIPQLEDVSKFLQGT